MTQLKTVEDCIPYAGWPNHSLYDAKSLALHSRIARNISKDPPAAGQGPGEPSGAGGTITTPTPSPPLLLNGSGSWPQPVQELAAFLVAVTDEAVILRHFSPFAGILAAAERQSILDAFDRELRRVIGDVIDINPDIMFGSPVFRGTRMPVDSLRDHLAGGYDLGDFLEEHPGVSREQATRLLDLSAETLMAEAGYEPLKQEERPDTCRKPHH